MERIESAWEFANRYGYTDAQIFELARVTTLRDADVRADEARRCAERAIVYVTEHTNIQWLTANKSKLRFAITQGQPEGEQG